MDTLDWYVFHQVELSIDEHNFIEVGGSLNPRDGLSVLYEENGEQFVKKGPPTTIQEMTDILLSDLSGNDNWNKSMNGIEMNQFPDPVLHRIHNHGTA